MKIGKPVGLIALILVVFFASTALFYISWNYDNKYTAKGPQPLRGILTLSEDDLRRHPTVWLVNDWEIYRGKLLTPADFEENPPTPDEFTFIGQYGGFEGKTGQNPHGSATYRLTINLPDQTDSYTLELPEIYSSYKLYINSLLMKELGDTSLNSFRPETDISAVTVQASGRMEIIVSVTDYSHFYSGMMYPPAFGEPSAIFRMMNMRLSLRILVCAVSLCIGLLYLLIGSLTGVRRENRLQFLYAALCFAFALYICYPVVKTLFPGGILLYRIEVFSYCAILLLVVLIQDRLIGMPRNLTKIFASLGIFACSVSIAAPILSGDNLKLMIAYSRMVGLYSLICAVYLTAGAATSILKGMPNGRLMLFGMTVFDASLVMDRLFPLFEPIRFGWFSELAGGLLVLLVGVALSLEIAKQIRLKREVETRINSVSKMLEVQRAYQPALLEKEKETREARHDLRHHINIIRELVSTGEIERLSLYLDGFSERQAAPAQTSYCEHYIVDTLLRMYAGLAEKQNTAFKADANIPCSLAIEDMDLCVILSNILENALEATLLLPQRERRITIRIGCKHSHLVVLLENTFSGNAQTRDGLFVSQKRKNHAGIGLSSLISTAKRYGGNANFYTKKNVFCCEVFLPDRQGGWA